MVMQTPFLLKKYYSGKILWIQIISTGIVGIKFDKDEGEKKSGFILFRKIFNRTKRYNVFTESSYQQVAMP